jgi:Carboxypeptidase regulatory-like domain
MMSPLASGAVASEREIGGRMFSRLSARARWGALASLVLLALLLAGLTFASAALAAPTPHFVAADSPNDICFDKWRNLLYITSGSQILRYDLSSQTYLAPFEVGGDLVGIDLSPDGSTIAVADSNYYGEAWHWPPTPDANNLNWIYLVDPDSGGMQEVDFQRTYGETGTWMVAFDDQDRVLVTSSLSGSGWTPMRRYDPETDSTDVMPGSVRQDSALSPSGDRSAIAWSESNSSNGPFGVYHSADGSIQTATSSGFLYDIAANHDGSQFAVPYGTVRLYNSALSPIGSLGSSIRNVKYSPTQDVLYAPVGGTSVINAYDANTSALITSYDTGQIFGGSTGNHITWPRLGISDDDTLLCSTCSGGFVYFDSRSSVHGNVRSSNGGGPVPTAQVQVWRQHDSSWSVESTLSVSDAGYWSYATTDTAPMRFRVFDPSRGHGSAWFGGTSLETASSAVATMGASPGCDVTLPFVRGGTLGGFVIDDTNGYGVDAEKVTAWSKDASPTTKYATTTSADGVYHFNDLPPGSYVVRFDDPTFKWHRQFYAGVDTTESADDVFVTGPGTFYAAAQMHRHVASLELTPADAAPGSQLVAEIGGVISVQTTCTDAAADDAPRNGMPVALQSSADGSTWTTESVGVTQSGQGVYRATITANTISTKYYRFVVPSSDYIDGTVSDSCLAHFYGRSRWNGDAQIAPGKSAGITVGQTTGVTCQLIRYDGSPATGRKVVLQASAASNKWWTSSVPVAEGANGYYTAIFAPIQGLNYRLVTVGSAAEPSVVSGPVGIWMNAPSNAWSDFGGGRSGNVNSSTDYGTSTHVDAWSTNFLESTETVRLYSSPDGVNFTPMSVPLTKAGLVLRYGVISAHYTATIPAITGLRYYCVVMQGAAGAEPAIPSPSYTIYVNPQPMFALSSPKSAKAGQRFTVSGLIRPHLVRGSRVVTLRVHRNGSSGTQIYSNIAVFDKSGFSGFSTRLKLRRGTYYVQAAVFPGGYTDGGPWGSVPAWASSQHSVTKKVVVR